MTLLCKEFMHLDSHMTTSAGLSCEAFENAMVCEMQPKCSEMRLRCGGRGCRRWLLWTVLLCIWWRLRRRKGRITWARQEISLSSVKYECFEELELSAFDLDCWENQLL